MMTRVVLNLPRLIGDNSTIHFFFGTCDQETSPSNESMLDQLASERNLNRASGPLDLCKKNMSSL
jgi:hypothetical protein